MSDQFNLEIVSPEDSFLKKDNVTEVVVPAFEGEMGILKEHISIISFLMPGIIKINSGNEENSFYVEDGILEFKDNTLSILTSNIFDIKNSDKTKIQNMIDEAENDLTDEKLNDQKLPGVEFLEIKYRPSGSIYHSKVPKFDGQSCSGIQIVIKDKDEYRPIVTATTLMLLIQRLHPREFQWEKDDYVDKLFGSNELRILSAQNKPIAHLPPIWAKDVYKFSEFRQSFLIY